MRKDVDWSQLASLPTTIMPLLAGFCESVRPPTAERPDRMSRELAFRLFTRPWLEVWPDR